MFKMGKISSRAERLIRVTEECVELGLAAAKPWGHLGDIADAINTHARAIKDSVRDKVQRNEGVEYEKYLWMLTNLSLPE